MRIISNSCLTMLVLLVVHSWSAPTFDTRAMDPPSVKISFAEGTLKAGAILDVSVTIPAGWHVNSDQPADEFLLPTSVEAGASGIVFDAPKWPKAKKLYSEALKIDYFVFDSTFHVQLPVKTVAAAHDSTSAKVVLHYQACSGAVCLAPSEVVATVGGVQELKKKIPESVAAQVQDSSSKPTQSEAPRSLPLLLLFAFIGGLILNLMPCVLPVLSIKALSLAKHARESRRKLLSMGFAMTMGILVSFWTLASVILVLQAAGGNAGWGFQFQNPGFLVGMIVLITLFALNMFGVFEIWLPSSAATGISQKASKKGMVGSFMNGVLMTLLSTPCSAPFLGSAMGYAFTQPPAILVLFFTTAGLGLAFPYMMLSLFPKTLKWIPKPGDWMNRFKQFLGFLMLTTAAWLLWVLGRQAGIEVLGYVLLLLVMLGFGAWVLGLVASPGNPFWKVVLSWMIMAAGGYGVFAFWVAKAIDTPVKKVETCISSVDGLPAPDAEGYYAWSPAVVDTLTAHGKTVFVDFTADWCLTCKTNEKAVLKSDEVQKAFKDMGIALVKGDFTRPDSLISKALKGFGRSGVPVYVIYSAHSPRNPAVLPELLTVQTVLDELAKAGASYK